ncbi:MAG: RluA family pseudouridine synthase [Ruminococcaceae bacterium]|nr:RluA family pseudouridine synthase [Oscillospiraceae bacterium]
MNIEYNSNREKTILFTVPSECDKIDAKTFLRRHCNISARTLSKLKRTKLGITRNNELLKTTDILNVGDVVMIAMPDDVNEIKQVQGELDILFEDEYVMVVNKPSMMPVHPTKIHQEDTLANIVAYYMHKKGEHYTFRAINRLDRDTSGCLLIAKDRYTAHSLPASVTKEYVAVCEGVISGSGTVIKPIKVMEGRSIQRVVADDGAHSVTHYYPVSVSNNHTLTRFVLETGRTHQIRCHMSSIGHPLAGDDMYGGSLKFISRQALHCHKIGFIHPITKEQIQIVSDMPYDILSVLKTSGT